MNVITCMEELKNVIYINLDTRPDRNRHVIAELKKVGVSATRLKAVKTKNGALGCTMSHICALKHAMINQWDYVVIVEDDITFLSPGVFVSQLLKFFQTNLDFDVLLLAGNNVGKYTPVDNTCIQVERCQTTTGYIVKKHYYEKLLLNFEEGLRQFAQQPTLPQKFAIDQYWFALQKADTWYMIIPATVTQKEGFSDIEKRNVSYHGAMLTIDKV